MRLGWFVRVRLRVGIMLSVRANGRASVRITAMRALAKI